MIKTLLAAFLLIVAFHVKAQNTGINTLSPKAALDVNGDLALRTGVLKCNAGDNINIDASSNRFTNYSIQLSGSGSFTVNGINGGTDGRLLNIYNSTAYAFTIYNNYASTPILANRILTGSDSLLVIYPKNSVSLRYDGSLSRWIILSSHRPDLWGYYAENIRSLNRGNVGIGIDSASAGLHIIKDGGIIAKGDTLSNNEYTLKETGAGAKLIWHPKKAAFMVGQLDASTAKSWNEDSIGFGAINLGYGNKIKGRHSFAAGIGNYISGGGFGSVAIGHNNFADSNEAVVIGYGNEARARQAIALGTGAIASGQSSLATGYTTRARGFASFAGGYSSTAKGDNSFSIGASNYTGSVASFAAGITDSVFEFNSPYGGAQGAAVFGWNNKVKGAFSLTAGTFNRTDSASYNSLVVGYGNISNGNENIVLGNSNEVYSRYSTVIGTSNTVGFAGNDINSLESAYILGRLNRVNRTSVAIGFGNYCVSDSSIAIGFNAYAEPKKAFAFGSNVYATGESSTAIGNFVGTGLQEGSFIIGDKEPNASVTQVFQNDAPNQMMMRFVGGYKLYTQGWGFNLGAQLLPGATSWSSLSDKRRKEKFIPVDAENILQKISGFHLTTWNYKGLDAATERHYGPMAQDFYAAFGTDAMGSIGCDTLINEHDFSGINFIAIQALEKRTAAISDQQRAIAALQKENTTLKETLDKTLLLVEALHKKLTELASNSNKTFSSNTK